MTEQKLKEAFDLSQDIDDLKRDISAWEKFRLVGNRCNGAIPDSYKDVEEHIKTFGLAKMNNRLKELELKFKKL